MSLIQKPKPVSYHTLNKKIKLTEDTYLNLLEYLKWSTQFNGEEDVNCFLEESLKYIFNNDKKFKRHLNSNKNKNKNKTVKQEALID